MDIRRWVGFKPVTLMARAFEVQLRTGSPHLQRERGQRFGQGKGSLAWLTGSELIIFSRQEFASWSCYVAGLHPLRLPPISKPFTVLPDIPMCHLVIGGQRGCSLNSQPIECGLCPQSNGEAWRT